MRLLRCLRGPFSCATPRTEVAEHKPHVQSNCFALLFLPIFELHLVRIACWTCREPSKWMLAEWNTAFTHSVLHAAFWWTAINYFRFCLCSGGKERKTEKKKHTHKNCRWLIDICFGSRRRTCSNQQMAIYTSEPSLRTAALVVCTVLLKRWEACLLIV